MDPATLLFAITLAARELQKEPPTSRERFAKIVAQYGKSVGITAEQVLAALDTPLHVFLPVTP